MGSFSSYMNRDRDNKPTTNGIGYAVLGAENENNSGGGSFSSYMNADRASIKRKPLPLNPAKSPGTSSFFADTRTVDGEEVTNFFRHPLKAIKESWQKSGEDLKAGKLQMSPQAIQERMQLTGLAPSRPGETTGFGNVVQRGIHQTMMLDPKEWKSIPTPTTGNKALDVVGNVTGLGLGFAAGPGNLGPAGGLLKAGAVQGEIMAPRLMTKTLPVLPKLTPKVSGAVSRLSPKLGAKVTDDLLYKVGETAIKDAAMGGTYGAGRALTNNEPFPKVVKDTGKEIALWTGLGLAGRGAFAGGKALKNKLLPGESRLAPREALKEVNKAYAEGKTSGVKMRPERQNVVFLSDAKKKNLQDIENEIKSMEQFIRGQKQALKQAAGEDNVYSYIKYGGGIKPSESLPGEYRESIPLTFKNNNGMELDELASELGMDSRQLLDELNRPKPRTFNAGTNPEIQAVQNTLNMLKAEREIILQGYKPSKLSQVTAGHAKEVESAIREAETPAIGLGLKVTGGTGEYKPVVQEVENAYKAGQAPLRSWVQKLGQRVSRIVEDFHIEPLLKEYPRVREHVRYTKEIPSMARMEATETLEGVLGDINRSEMDLFTRKVVYEDWIESLRKGEEIPFKLASGEVYRELANVDKFLTPKLKRAYERHLEVVNAMADDLVSRGKLAQDAVREKYFPHKVLFEYGQMLDEKLGLPQKLRTPFRGYVQRRQGSTKPIATDYIETMHNLVTKVKIDNAIDDAIETLAKLGEEYTNKAVLPKELIEKVRRTGVPETYKGKTYRAWQPDTGNYFYPSLTITEEAVQKALAEQLPLEVQTIIGEAVEQGLVIGRRKPTFVLPEQVAERLNNFRRVDNETEISKILQEYTRWWKKLAVLMPGPKHDWFNLFGDLDRWTTGLGVKELPKMLWEASRMIKNKDPQLKEFLEKGVFSSEVYMYNVGKYSSPKLRELAGPLGKAAYLNPVSLYQRWRVYREAAPRIAAHLLNTQRLQEGKPLVNRFRVDVEGLLPEEAVAKIGRETMIDYNMLSKNTEHAKKFSLPFITWYAQNFSSYVNLVAKKPLYGLARVFMPMAALTVWNRVMFPEVEKNLPDYWRENPHLITGIQNSEGGYYVIPVPFAGAIAASMVGLHTLPDTVARYITGETSLGEAFKKQGKDIAMGPAGAAYDLATPFARGPFEIARNKDWRGFTIVPRELEGTPEALKIRVKHLGKSLIPPISKGMQWVGEAEQAEKGNLTTPLYARPFGAKALDPAKQKQRDLESKIYEYTSEEVRNKARYDFTEAYKRYKANPTPANLQGLKTTAARLSETQIKNIIDDLENPNTKEQRLDEAFKRVPKALRPELERELLKIQNR